MHDPFAILAAYARRGAKPFDPCAHVTGPFGQCLGQLSRVNIPIIGVIQAARQIMGFDKGVFFLDRGKVHHFQV